MPDISDRIRQLVLKFADGNNTKFASMVGTSEANIRNYMRGREPKAELLKAIINELNINPYWLLDGKGEILQEEQAKYMSLKSRSVMHVPLVNQYAYAGYMNGYQDEEFIRELPTVPFVTDQEHKGKYICFEVRGDSMDDGSHESLLEGDIILCREVAQDHWKARLHINKWDFVIVHKEKGILVKRIINHDVKAGEITLHSLNDYYPDQTVKLSEVGQIFNVIDVQRNRRR